MQNNKELGIKAFTDKMEEIYRVAMENNHTEKSLMGELDSILRKVQKKRIPMEVIRETTSEIILAKTSDEVDDIFNKFMRRQDTKKDHNAVIVICSVVRTKYSKEGWEQ